ncbi:autotransporter outer membrane beta-barrel domain-containing protein [Pseudomonas sp. RIT-PI-S]|uniref:autotransporter family protein n=1 Tax=Pseudomonas sp. RIT-PI-S TaxID=3035295 RepID=UPI0021D8165D|nr:autotransporter outer membrane beta-barrel domain-containing protein [Pseudomonas sp. RIT-PI-S]
MDNFRPGQRWQSAKTRTPTTPLPPLCGLSLAVMFAILALPSESARADSCERRTTVLAGVASGPCVLGTGEQLQVTQGGELAVTGAAAVAVSPGATARQVLSSGHLAGAYGVDITDATLAGKLLNTAGALLSGEQGAVRVANGTLGAFANAGEVLVTGRPQGDSAAVQIDHSTVKGNVNNAGTITANSAYSAVVLRADQVGGDVKNSGEINGHYVGMSIENTAIAGSFNNSGTITGGGALFISNSTIGQDFINSGVVSSTFSLSRTSIGRDFINTGVIDGSDFAVITDAHIGGNLINTGGIYGGSGADITADIQGSLINKGAMYSGIGAFGIDGAIGGGIFNSGSIVGGLGGGTGAVINAQTPELVNSGYISGSATGLYIGTGAVIGHLVNSGIIEGDQRALVIDADAAVGDVHITGNRARFAGLVQAPATPFFIDTGATYQLLPGDQLQVKSLANQGRLVLGAPSTAFGEHSIIDGDFVQASGGVLRTEVADSSRYGQVVVTGTASLPSQARIEVDVAAAGQPLDVGRLQNVLSAGTLVSDGTFNVSSNSTLFAFSAVKDGNTLDLLLAARSPTGVQSAVTAAGLGQAAHAAQVVDRELAKGSASALAPYFATATSEAQVAGAVAATLPMGNQALRASQTALTSINRVVNQHLATTTALGGPGQPGSPLWAQSFSYGGARPEASENAAGTVIGMDTRLASGNRVGMAFAYSEGSASAGGTTAQGSRLDLWQFMAYGSHPLDDHTDARLYAGAGNNRISARRDLELSGSGGAVNADYNSLIATVGSSIGQVIALGEGTRFMPSARLEYNHVHEGAYKERGPASVQPLLLSVAERDSNQLVAGLDGALEHALTPLTRLRLDLGVGYDLLNENPSTSAAYAAAPGERFSVRGEASQPWLLNSGLGLVSRWQNGTELSVNHEVQRRSDFSEQITAVRLVIPF